LEILWCVLRRRPLESRRRRVLLRWPSGSDHHLALPRWSLRSGSHRAPEVAAEEREPQRAPEVAAEEREPPRAPEVAAKERPVAGAAVAPATRSHALAPSGSLLGLAVLHKRKGFEGRRGPVLRALKKVKWVAVDE
jgi:hypothetical protein